MKRGLDEIDKRIIYELMQDARNVSAPTIADQMDVSPGTIRNRISQLEADGIITGYHARVNFEEADDRLMNDFVCTAPIPEREKLAAQLLQIPGVIEIRELMAGRGNVRVTAVGNDMDDITRIARAISTLGVEIEDEKFVQREYYQPYQHFGPNDRHQIHSITDFLRLTGGAEVAEFTIADDAVLAGKTLHEANDEGLIEEETLIVAIERDGTIITPRGHTAIRSGDLVTVFSKNGATERLIRRFNDER